MNNKTYCEFIRWSPQATTIVKPIFYLCIFATMSHILFWIQFIAYPSVRQHSMQWVYAYLITDELLLVRFFLIYAYRWLPVCVPYIFRMAFCYAEAIFDNYLNLLQSYILLALNISRYLQIAYNHNVYSSNGRLIVVAHIAIYITPLFGHIISIICGWCILENPPGDVCDLLPVSLTIRLFFLLFSYFIPVILTLIFLLFSLNYIHNTQGIQTQVIVDARLKYHRQLVVQSGVFYSLWLILWSPHLVVFPFFYKNSTVGTVAQILNYLSILVDPIVITALDVRFLRAWKSTGEYFRRYIRRQQSVRVPVTYPLDLLERAKK
ncbi:unnamed protein product [Rotaria magnacalcarata]|uniref:G-protein coupled receptors family 1 profile domain-containing protein n=1 Tax=Rotaria magnacalcarata TaxID=392030 RepID=A0A819GUT7_9BILA|nr:unnamed protein product [Rotaria magnacalcarata]CAF2092521.1 unnamed protein product [Rotaria magnacalcarata]CAF3891666.1 unnamed protein product [Rotaria magnacalcarata]CAF3960744.1 unnamed protein product [Rotaria magnacalcarata]